MAVAAGAWFIILELFASKLLKRVWPLLNTLQCILVIRLYHVYLPNQVKELLKIIQEILELKHLKEISKEWAVKTISNEKANLKETSIFENPVALTFCIIVPGVIVLIAIIGLLICCLKGSNEAAKDRCKKCKEICLKILT